MWKHTRHMVPALLLATALITGPDRVCAGQDSTQEPPVALDEVVVTVEKQTGVARLVAGSISVVDEGTGVIVAEISNLEKGERSELAELASNLL